MSKKATKVAANVAVNDPKRFVGAHPRKRVPQRVDSGGVDNNWSPHTRVQVRWSPRKGWFGAHGRDMHQAPVTGRRRWSPRKGWFGAHGRDMHQAPVTGRRRWRTRDGPLTGRLQGRWSPRKRVPQRVIQHKWSPHKRVVPQRVNSGGADNNWSPAARAAAAKKDATAMVSSTEETKSELATVLSALSEMNEKISANASAVAMLSNTAAHQQPMQQYHQPMQQMQPYSNSYGRFATWGELNSDE